MPLFPGAQLSAGPGPSLARTGAGTPWPGRGTRRLRRH